MQPGDENLLSNRQYIPFQKQKSIMNQSISTKNKKQSALEQAEAAWRLPTPDEAFRAKRKSMGEGSQDTQNSPKQTVAAISDSIVITDQR